MHGDHHAGDHQIENDHGDDDFSFETAAALLRRTRHDGLQEWLFAAAFYFDGRERPTSWNPTRGCTRHLQCRAL